MPLPKPWRNSEPDKGGLYLIVLKPWRTRMVAAYVPVMDRPWGVDTRWYAADAIECWCALPQPPEESRS